MIVRIQGFHSKPSGQAVLKKDDIAQDAGDLRTDMGKLNTKGQSSTYNQGQRDRKGKAKERRAKQKGKTEGKAILTTNVKAIEQGNLPAFPEA